MRINKSKKFLKNKLSIAVSTALIPLILTTGQIAYAAEDVEVAKAAVEVAKVDETEVIEVTGFRASATRQLNNKRFSNNISDSIFAEDMGKMPDSNIAEAMSRITGIGIERVDGAGTEITIRGAEGSLNNVQMNGVTMTNSGDNNSVDFSAMSADMLRSIEVIKSPSANHDEGSIGGTVLLNTWKPLDIKEPKTTLSSQLKYNDLSEEYDPTVSFSFGKNFSDKFGMTFGGNYAETSTRQDRVTNYRWQYRNIPTAYSLQTGEELDPDGNTRTFDPFAYEKNYSLITTKRVSLSSTLQYNINDNASLWVDLTHSALDKTKEQYNHSVQNLWVGATAIVDEESGTSASISGTGVQSRLVSFEQPNEAKTNTIGINYQQLLFDGDWTLDALVAYSGSTSFNPLDNRRLIFNSGAANAQPGTVSWLNDNDELTINTEFAIASGQPFFDPDTMPVQAAQYLTRDTKDTSYSYQLDLQGDVEFGPIVGLGFGAKIVDRDREGESFVQALNLDNNLDANGESASGTLLSEYSTPFPVDNYLERVVQTDNNGWYLPTLDAFYDTFVPDSSQLTELNDRREDEEPNNTSFDSTAIYAMADYEFFDGKLLGDFGVRWVETKATAAGTAGYRFTNWDPEGEVDEEGNVIGGAFNAGNFQISDDSFGDIKYTNLLPSFNARYLISDEMILRGSVSKTMSRPKPTQMIPGYLITARNGSENPTARGGNPDLKPTEVIGYDLSWEWYFEETAMVSVAGFYKDFVSMSYQKNQEQGFDCPALEAFPEGQQQYSALHCAQVDEGVGTRTTVNGDGGLIYGVELSYQQDFTFLPGWAQYFGTIINYTYADSEASYVDKEQAAERADLLDGFPMLNTSKDTLNATLYWENEGFSARLAYNYRSKRLNNPSDWDGALWTDDRTTVDFSSRYQVNEHLSLTLAITNLTDTYNRIFITRLNEDPDNGLYSEGSALDGAPDFRTFILDHNGRNFRLGLTYQF